MVMRLWVIAFLLLVAVVSIVIPVANTVEQNWKSWIGMKRRDTRQQNDAEDG